MEAHGRKKVEAAWRAGRRLRRAKELVGHGGWLPWLRKQGLPQRTANDYMTLAEFELAKFADFHSRADAYAEARRLKGGGGNPAQGGHGLDLWGSDETRVQRDEGKTTYQTPPAIVEKVRAVIAKRRARSLRHRQLEHGVVVASVRPLSRRVRYLRKSDAPLQRSHALLQACSPSRQ